LEKVAAASIVEWVQMEEGEEKGEEEEGCEED
jgi:hypothetical protein